MKTLIMLKKPYQQQISRNSCSILNADSPSKVTIDNSIDFVKVFYDLNNPENWRNIPHVGYGPHKFSFVKFIPKVLTDALALVHAGIKKSERIPQSCHKIQSF